MAKKLFAVLVAIAIIWPHFSAADEVPTARGWVSSAAQNAKAWGRWVGNCAGYVGQQVPRAWNAFRSATSITQMAPRLNQVASQVATRTGQIAQQGFNVVGRLQAIWNNPRLFMHWIKGSQSISRVGNPLSHVEARQLVDNAQRIGLQVEMNPSGLQGLEQTGQWARIPHLKIGDIHIPLLPGFEP